MVGDGTVPTVPFPGSSPSEGVGIGMMLTLQPQKWPRGGEVKKGRQWWHPFQVTVGALTLVNLIEKKIR